MKKYLLSIGFGISMIASAQNIQIVPLGVYGGSNESNLSSYLIGEETTNSYLALDAGTILSGINKAIEKGTFEEQNNKILKNYIKGYFISHGHLDHLSGMIINSPEDSNKPIYGISETISVLKNKYFTNDAWANFANEGESPILNKYYYKYAKIGMPFTIEGTNFTGTIYELSHVNPLKSSAILVENGSNAVLYFGDTGADRIEKTQNLSTIWKAISPKIKSGKLKTMMLEVSFPNSQPEKLLFGHLTPKLMNEELNELAKEVGKSKLKGLTIIVTHIKPKDDYEQKIKDELLKDNPYNINYIFPQQGERIILK
ncbi:MBL fold metallo-hydrolase [Empedobacter falsenii]|uniref:3',5'-cyclic-nucleotide phosphodiesterase n=1 Tax=Empedobacter falsenii TaxID=343874 RepID=A0A427BHS3_9FLAO|nr:3',5'-cyclic-nucleotide phosphodiesterase [Empedobacter falsenii]RRT87983.1 3',5'-cyclic-nucleotide phosphodiesterase [Empedobacter falsenii]RRT88791.1 3',5'-cyclic-nucleotide phosphodiesterase [Empedobacter falsenii]